MSRKSPAVRAAMARVVKASPGALTSSYFSTGNRMYVSEDRHTTFLQVYLPGRAGLDVKSGAGKIRAAAAAGLPAGISVDVTGATRSARRATARAADRASSSRR